MRKVGHYVDSSPKTWVQTERAAHEAWGLLAVNSPRAAGLLHHLVANMGHQNAIVINQKTLAKIMRCTVRTVQRAIDDLVADHWIQSVSLGGAGTVNAYVVNDQVAWGESRESMPRVSTFSARVVADIDDQSEQTLARSQLRRIPILYPHERQLPSGPGEAPPSQPAIPGMEPDLPALSATSEQLAQEDMKARLELEKRGQQRLME